MVWTTVVAFVPNQNMCTIDIVWSGLAFIFLGTVELRLTTAACIAMNVLCGLVALAAPLIKHSQA